MSKRVDYGSTAICAGGKYAELYSRAMKFAAMSLISFARETGYLAGFSDRQYKLRKAAVRCDQKQLKTGGSEIWGFSRI